MAWLFSQGSTSLHSNFTSTGSSPSNHSGDQKIRDTGLPKAEDRIPPRSLVLTQHCSETDRRTDRQTDGFSVAYARQSVADQDLQTGGGQGRVPQARVSRRRGG